MLLIFLIIGLVLIALVTYGFGVVNKMPTTQEGPTREEEVNKLTDAFNEKRRTLATQYREKKKGLLTDKEQLKKLNVETTKEYDAMHQAYLVQVKAVTAPPAKENPVRKYWNKVIYGGVLASLTCCTGSGFYTACSQEEEPQKEVTTSEAWTADNIPMPHFEDENQYVANPDNVLSKNTVDSMNLMLRFMDTELGIETAFAVVNHCEGGDAFRLAQDMGNKYGVGRNNRGLVVVMAYGDHDINISPGNDLESTLSDGVCGRLLDDYAVPFLKKNQPDSAMLYLTRALREALQHQDELSPVYEKPATDEERDLGIVSTGTLGLWGMLGLLRRRLNKKGLMKENAPRMKQALPNPVFETNSGGGYAAGGSYGSSSYRSSCNRSSSYRSSSSSSRRGGSYGGGSFGGGGASRKW